LDIEGVLNRLVAEVARIDAAVVALVEEIQGGDAEPDDAEPDDAEPDGGEVNGGVDDATP
jgi:hypothetical protein